MTGSRRTDRLTVVNRSRVLVRRVLFWCLRVVPDRAVIAVHDKWIGGTSVTAWFWHPLAAVLFYRPIPGRVIDIPGGAGERLVVAGSRMERTLWWFGETSYENGEVSVWRALCADAENVLEIGANIGYYTVVGARATQGSYTTVEPNPDAARVVELNVEANAVENVEIVVAAAVGPGSPTRVELALPDQEAYSTAPTGAFLRGAPEDVVTDRPASRFLSVETVSASSLFVGRDLVKLDIEGSEALVLEAAREEIRFWRPTLVVEVLAGSSRLQHMIEELVGEGYVLRSVREFLRMFSLARLPDHIGGDIVLTPGERLRDNP